MPHIHPTATVWLLGWAAGSKRAQGCFRPSKTSQLRDPNLNPDTKTQPRAPQPLVALKAAGGQPTYLTHCRACLFSIFVFVFCDFCSWTQALDRLMLPRDTSEPFQQVSGALCVLAQRSIAPGCPRLLGMPQWPKGPTCSAPPILWLWEACRYLF